MNIKNHQKLKIQEYKGIKLVSEYKYLGVTINNLGKLDFQLN